MVLPDFVFKLRRVGILGHERRCSFNDFYAKNRQVGSKSVNAIYSLAISGGGRIGPPVLNLGRVGSVPLVSVMTWSATILSVLQAKATRENYFKVRSFFCQCLQLPSTM